MTVTTSPHRGWAEWAFIVPAYLASLPAAFLPLFGLVVLVGAYRLLAEWQRRVTLVALAERAPEGTVVVQGAGQGGPALWMRVGVGRQQLPWDGPA